MLSVSHWSEYGGLMGERYLPARQWKADLLCFLYLILARMATIWGVLLTQFLLHYNFSSSQRWKTWHWRLVDNFFLLLKLWTFPLVLIGGKALSLHTWLNKRMWSVHIQSTKKKQHITKPNSYFKGALVTMKWICRICIGQLCKSRDVKERGEVRWYLYWIMLSNNDILALP